MHYFTSLPCPFFVSPDRMGTPPMPGSISRHFEHPHLAAMGGHCTKSVQLLESELGFLKESFLQALIPLSLAQLLRTSQPSKGSIFPRSLRNLWEEEPASTVSFSSPGLQHSGQLWTRWHSWSSQPDPLPKAVPALRSTPAESWEKVKASPLWWVWHWVFQVSWCRGSAVTQFVRVSCLHPTRFSWQGHAPGRNIQFGWINSQGCQQERLPAEVKRLSAELCWMFSVQPELQVGTGGSTAQLGLEMHHFLRNRGLVSRNQLWNKMLNSKWDSC